MVEGRGCLPAQALCPYNSEAHTARVSFPLVFSEKSTEGKEEKGCKRTVARIDISVYILSCTYCDSFFAAVPSHTTRTYIRTYVRTVGLSRWYRVSRRTEEHDIHGIEVTRLRGTLGEAEVRRTREEEDDTRREREGTAVCCSMRQQEEDETRDRLPGERRTERVSDGQGNRNEYQNRGAGEGGGGGNMCAWRGRRGSTGELDFSDSEFCSSFFLRPPSPFPAVCTHGSLSLFHHQPLITDSPYPVGTGDVHHVFPGVPFIPPPPYSLFNHHHHHHHHHCYHHYHHRHRRPSPPPYTRPLFFSTVLCSLFLSLDLHLVLWLCRRVARRRRRRWRPRRPNRWWCCRHNKTWKKRWPTVHAGGRARGEKERDGRENWRGDRVHDRVLGYPLGPRGEPRKERRERSRRSMVLRGYS